MSPTARRAAASPTASPAAPAAGGAVPVSALDLLHAAAGEDAAAPVLRAEALQLAYGARTVVGAGEGVDLEIAPGRLTALVGANGSGKSTLLRGLARLLAPQAGRVTLDGVDVARIPSRRIARAIGVLPQSPIAPEGIRVAELVARGRYPHQGIFRGRRSDDDLIVAAALEATDAMELVDRRVDELSGGQRQRVWIAMALAQQPRILLLDEPTSALDIAHQVEVLDVLRAEVARGMTVVLVIHDLTLAARYADDLVVMADGAIIARGAPGAVLTGEVVQRAFGVEARVLEDPDTGRPVILPRSQPAE
ncbi:ABC transporter ATP-binding protein [Microcella flavibacter]|uniref:ABC transporter ATP-binding protein n=1 Tax=Microcella flavibacter TaxID=1804990 RepID=UPI0014568BF1|nr:ABC transporter ATP-binding protein [Microcella flavibacter]